MNGVALPPTGLHSSVNGRKDKETKNVHWAYLIEHLLSKETRTSSPTSNTLDQTIATVQEESQVSFNSPHFWRSFETLRQQLINLYSILSQETLSPKTRPYLASQQQDLLYASLAVERAKFRDAQIKCVGANRFFSQISFFSFISSSVGSELLKQLSKKMKLSEAAIFEKVFHCLNHELSHDYFTVLSIIEAAKFLIDNNKNLENTHFLKEVENLLINSLTNIFQHSHLSLIPLGWSFLNGHLGHHFLMLVEKLSKHNDGMFRVRVMDTSKKSQKSLQAVDKAHSISQPIFFEAVKSKEERSLEMTRKCSESIQMDDLTDKIERLAKILMLQIPRFTNTKMRSLNIPDTKAPKIFTDIHYSILTGNILLEDQTPLAEWQDYSAPACAFSLFQPLLQTLALQVAKEQNISLSESEETNLKHYFELLLQSHKLYLTKKMDLDQIEKEKITTILHRTLKESGDLISTAS